MQNTSDSLFIEDNSFKNIRETIFKYLSYWPWYILTVIVSLSIAYIYLRYQTPVYNIKASLLIKDEKKVGQAQSSQILEDLNLSSSNKLVENEIKVLKSRPLAEKVIDKLNLTTTYWAEGKFHDIEIYDKTPIKVLFSDDNVSENKNPFYIQQVDENRFRLFNKKLNNIGEFKFSNKIKSSYGNFRVFFDKNNSSEYKGKMIKIIKKTQSWINKFHC